MAEGALLWDGWRDELLVRGCPASSVDRIGCYLTDLLHFNRVNNLVSRRDPLAQVRLLALESIEVHAWAFGVVGVDGPVMDIGSGGGVPGLFFACLEPERTVTLLERRRGRCDFLRREVRALGLSSVEVLEADAVDAAVGGRLDSQGLVTLKAVAPPAEALELARPYLARSGRALLFQRPGWAPEAVDGGSSWVVEASWVASTPPLQAAELAAHLVRCASKIVHPGPGTPEQH